MPILKSLKLTDVSDLRSEASNFQNHADGVKSVTDNMLQLINQTSSLWRGDAQSKYSTQFEGLRDDMAKIYEMCKEYSDDLIEIANNYERAESDNIDTASRLKADVELRV